MSHPIQGIGTEANLDFEPLSRPDNDYLAAMVMLLGAIGMLDVVELDISSSNGTDELHPSHLLVKQGFGPGIAFGAQLGFLLR
jgi:hypothetical protein